MRARFRYGVQGIYSLRGCVADDGSKEEGDALELPGGRERGDFLPQKGT